MFSSDEQGAKSAMLYRFFYCAAMVLALTVFGRAQAEPCGAFDKKVTYTILLENITNRDSKRRIYLEIFVRKERFTVNSMVALIERIRNEYCEFDEIAVSLQDTKKKDKIPGPHPLATWYGERTTGGFYEYRKSTNTGELSFQEIKAGRVTDVEIIFEQDNYCVTKTVPDRSGLGEALPSATNSSTGRRLN